MVVQNNPTPWIFLALVVMGGCALTGMLLGGVGPLSSDIAVGKLEITQTQAAINAYATQSALEAEQSGRERSARKTAMVEAMTEMPKQEIATYNAQVVAAQADQVAATGTVLANQAYNEQLMAQATRTAVANQMIAQDMALDATATAIGQQQVWERSQTVLFIVLVGVGTITLAGWIVARALTRAAIARAQVLSSQAEMLAQQRRLEAMRATKREDDQEVRAPRYPLPKSLLSKKHGDADELPKAE